MQYLILSFGGMYVTEEDKDHGLKITHQVVDRPMVGKLDSTREYVQPQWIVDSVNSLFLLPTQPYRAGVPPPPHLSPFIDNSKEGYIPTRLKEINALKGEIVDEEMSGEDEESSGDEQNQTPLAPVQQAAAVQPVAKTVVKGDADSSSEEEGGESDNEETLKKQKKVKNAKLKKELAKEQEELGKILMTKKQRQLYEQVDKSNQSKKQQAQKLKEKRNKIEQSRKK